MIILNHCGITNAVYYSSHFPQPYSIPVEAEGKVQLDYTPAGVDFANLKDAVQFQVDQRTRRHEIHIWQDKYTRLNTISHIVTIHDKLARDFTVLLNGQSEWQNWIFMYLPTSIYEDANWAGFAAIESDAARFRQGHDHWPNHRISGGPYCWWLYYRCNFCGAYSAQSQLWEYCFSALHGINRCKVIYYA